MALRYRRYAVGQVLFLVLGIGAALAVGSGMARAVFPGLSLPAGRVPLALGLAAFGLGGFAGMGHLRIRRWDAIGREVGLSPDESARLTERLSTGPGGTITTDPLPDLTGTVNGRPVRVTTYSTAGGSPESGTSPRTFTVVKATLESPIADALIVSGSADGVESGLAAVATESLPATTIDDVVVFGADAEDRGRELLSGRVRTVLESSGASVGAILGDPTDLILEGLMGDMGGQLALMAGEEQIRQRLHEHPAHDPSAVSCSTESRHVDASDLRRQIEMVTALAAAADRVDLAADAR